MMASYGDYCPGDQTGRSNSKKWEFVAAGVKILAVLLEFSL